MRRLLFSIFLVLSLAFVAGVSVAAQVYHHPRPAEKLHARWVWALESANKKGVNDGFWVAYSIQHLIGENTFFASNGRYTYHTSYHTFDLMDGKSLGEMIYGQKMAPDLSDEEQVRKVAQKALEELDNPHKEQRKGLKDVAILFLYKPPSDLPENIRYNNLSVPFNPNGLPLFWLDKASRKAVEALEDFAFNDSNTQVQKHAVYALEDLPDGEGIPYLIKIANEHPNPSVRKSAIYSLGDSDDSRALEALVQIIRKKN